MIIEENQPCFFFNAFLKELENKQLSFFIGSFKLIFNRLNLALKKWRTILIWYLRGTGSFWDANTFHFGVQTFQLIHIPLGSHQLFGDLLVWQSSWLEPNDLQHGIIELEGHNIEYLNIPFVSSNLGIFGIFDSIIAVFNEILIGGLLS